MIRDFLLAFFGFVLAALWMVAADVMLVGCVFARTIDPTMVPVPWIAATWWPAVAGFLMNAIAYACLIAIWNRD